LGLVEIDVLDFDIPDLDGELDINPDSGLTNANVLAGLMLRLGLTGVPVTIIISLLALFGWIICYYLVHFLSSWVPDGLLYYVVGFLGVVFSLYVAAKITSIVVKPLRPLFEKAQQEATKHILGQTAIVRTLRVDNTFGEAFLEDGGAGLILKVRTRDDQTFKKGDRVVLLEYQKINNIYYVISEEDFRA